MNQINTTFTNLVTAVSALTDKVSGVNFKLKNLKTSQIQNDKFFTTAEEVFTAIVSATSGKVDKEENKSLVSNTQIQKLSAYPTLDNFIKTIQTNISGQILDPLKDFIDTKADKATTLSGYNILDAFTKQEINDTFMPIVSTYTKQQADDIFATLLNTYTKTQVDTAITSASGSILQQLGGAFQFKGTKANLTELNAITNPKNGDVWQVLSGTNNNTNCEYAWNGIQWTELGSTVDLSQFAKSDYVDHKIEESSNILENFITTLSTNTSNTIEILSTNTITNISNLSSTIYTYVYGEFGKRPIDITSFQVLANNEDILPGYNSSLGGTITQTIPANMTHKMIIRCVNNNDTQSDVYIDWGDNTTSYISKQNYVNKIIDETNNVYPFIYEFDHTYTTPGFYDITIYGKKYVGVEPIVTETENYNLMSKCFDNNHGFASHLKTAKGFAKGALRLINVSLPIYHNVWNVIDWTECFLNCTNLLYAKGFEQFIRQISSVNSMFANCINLQECDLCCQKDCDCPSTFINCSNLLMDIADFLPTKIGGFSRANVNLTETFAGCGRVYISDPIKVAQVLWNDLNINFIHDDTFRDCSIAVRDQIPESWSGTLDLKSYPEQLQEKILSLQ